MLGGIAASGTKDRAWYVQNLLITGKKLEVAAWEDVAFELGHFLWLECGCDSGGRILWEEVQRESLLAEAFPKDERSGI